MTTKPALWKFNSEVLPREWAAANELVEDKSARLEATLSPLVDKRKPDLVAILEELGSTVDLDRTVFDHKRGFRRASAGNAVVAMSTSPYERAVLGRFSSRGKACAEISAIAASLGLQVRIGHPSDTMYLSSFKDDPTLPIVWWNPKRIDLPYPAIADPNPSMSHRYVSD